MHVVCREHKAIGWCRPKTRFSSSSVTRRASSIPLFFGPPLPPSQPRMLPFITVIRPYNLHSISRNGEPNRESWRMRLPERPRSPSDMPCLYARRDMNYISRTRLGQIVRRNPLDPGNASEVLMASPLQDSRQQRLTAMHVSLCSCFRIAASGARERTNRNGWDGRTALASYRVGVTRPAAKGSSSPTSGKGVG
jgi:hypothetical protein